MGERYFLSTAAGELARAVYAQGRYAEAEELTRLAEDLSAATISRPRPCGARFARRRWHGGPRRQAEARARGRRAPA